MARMRERVIQIECGSPDAPRERLGLDLLGTNVVSVKSGMHGDRSGVHVGSCILEVDGVAATHKGVCRRLAGGGSHVLRVQEYQVEGDVLSGMKYLWVTGLPETYPADRAESLFRQCGTVFQMWQRGGAYVLEYRTPPLQALKALKELVVEDVEGQHLTVEYRTDPSLPPAPAPRRPPQPDPRDRTQDTHQGRERDDMRPRRDTGPETTDPSATADGPQTPMVYDKPPTLPSGFLAWFWCGLCGVAMNKAKRPFRNISGLKLHMMKSHGGVREDMIMERDLTTDGEGEDEQIEEAEE